MTLSFGLDFKNLYTLDGIQTIDHIFLTFVGDQNPSLLEQLEDARRNPNFDAATESALILSVSPLLDDFLRHLFSLEEKKTLQDLSLLYKIKRQFVQRILLKRACNGSLDANLLLEKMTTFLGQSFDEIVFAKKIQDLLEEASLDEETLNFLALYAKWAEKTKEGQDFHKGDILFKTPKPLQFDHLVSFEEIYDQGVLKKYATETQARDGFHWLDEGLSPKEAFDAASYCVKCHPQGKDSCSKGMRDANGHSKTNPLGNALTGCPLKQKISEMMVMYEQGYILAALSIVMIDNPLLAMTGYRICNDCMKACIFQKQEPVNVPGVESSLLKDALHLPYGFEMYSLLTRWNPLKFKNFIAEPSQSKSVLVVGLGPAGIALSYYLLRAGFRVVGIDGSKIERLSERWVGDRSRPFSFDPVVQVRDLFENLEDRTIQGFGGVMEYGITVRWDKNLLTIMQLILERHPYFRLYDGIRFGGTLGLEEARSLGFDHVAFCVGAGEPKQPPIPGIFAKGIRFASDFLMSLHLTGAYKKESLVNTDIELPLVVVGAGLTAVDAATEALAYYPRLVERFYETYQTLALKMGEARVERCWNEEEKQRALRYIEHAKALIQERARAERSRIAPDFLSLLNRWGGVTLICRTPINHTQSYKLNHEELSAAMRLGVRVVDNISPEAFLADSRGQVRALKATHQGEVVEIEARSVLIATGTADNTIVNEESRETLNFNVSSGVGYSRWGDYHPDYAGSVVKAIASVKDHVEELITQLHKSEVKSTQRLDFKALDDALRPVVVAIKTLAPSIVELVVKAPLATKRSKPGQFFKIQSYHTHSVRGGGYRAKGVALSRAWVDEAAGHIGFIVLEHGASTQLIRSLQVGDALHMMGPTGAPTEITPVQTLLMIGGGLGNAVLFSIGQAYRALGTRVIYVAAYREEEKIFKVDAIEEAADTVIWAIENASTFKARRSGDHVVKGTVIDGLRFVLDEPKEVRHHIEKLLVIGSEGMIWAIKKTLDENSSYFPKLKSAIAGVNSPMQCMMKGICGQCIQKHCDPKTGKESFVFSCKNQDQNLETLDSAFLTGRLAQNRTSEKLQTLLLECRSTSE